jgi:hypothetical protein
MPNVGSFDALQWKRSEYGTYPEHDVIIEDDEPISRFWMPAPLPNASASRWTRCYQKKDMATMRTDLISSLQQGVALGFACGFMGFLCVLGLSSPILSLQL